MNKSSTKKKSDLITSEPIARKLREYLSTARMELAGIANKDKEDNRASFLHSIHVWQEISRIAKTSHDAAWERARTNDVLVPDEYMRALGAGDHTVLSTTHYVATAAVSNPPESFDLPGFIAVIATRYKIKPELLVSIAESCKKEGAPRLTKRVLEA